jgi:glycine/D-amino acid oxidase-like deaminating enzyme
MEWVEGKRVVQSIHLQSGQSTETLPCHVIVNCAGPHSHQVNLALKCPLSMATAPQRQLIIEAQCQDDLRRFPAIADLAEGFYIRPDKEVFKVGAVLPQHHVDFVQTPGNDAKEEPIQAFEELLLSRLSKRAPGLKLTHVQTHNAYYDWTVSDSYPILDGTDVQGYYAAIGTSGAWFKSAPVIGTLMAERIDRDDRGDTSTLVTLPLSGNSLDLSVFSASRPL